jgi:hypothetical protein
MDKRGYCIGKIASFLDKMYIKKLWYEKKEIKGD